MSFTPKNSFNDDLKLMKQCPLCKKDYKVNGLKLVEEKGSARMVHVTCSFCGSAILAMIVTSPMGVSSVGIITDLTLADAKKFIFKAPISEDDLLNFHEILEKQQSLFIKSLIG